MKQTPANTAVIFNIQRFSIQDGPGIRTTVFFKGCPLRCLWCSNPESQSPLPQIAHRNSLCNGCGYCLKVCAPQAISFSKGDSTFKIRIDREKCDDCGKCIDACPQGALRVYGRHMTVDEVLDEVKRDIEFYANSGGGVTAGGGEPLRQADFVDELFRRCHALGMHTTLDTCGYASVAALEKVLAETDLVLFDLKLLKTQPHKEATCKDNRVILRNARLVLASRVPMYIRIPLIPGVNDLEDNLQATARFVSELNSRLPVNLLPYHRFGVSKYEMLDMEYRLSDLKPFSDGQVQAAVEIFRKQGLDCTVQE